MCRMLTGIPTHQCPFILCTYLGALAGAILAPSRRTVSSAVRAMSLDQQKQHHRCHRVLSRARWLSTEVSRILLGLLVGAFVPEGPLVLGIGEMLERRTGPKNRAKGIYCDIRYAPATPMGLPRFSGSPSLSVQHENRA
jgi:hypothetical protein